MKLIDRPRRLTLKLFNDPVGKQVTDEMYKHVGSTVWGKIHDTIVLIQRSIR